MSDLLKLVKFDRVIRKIKRWTFFGRECIFYKCCLTIDYRAHKGKHHAPTGSSAFLWCKSTKMKANSYAKNKSCSKVLSSKPGARRCCCWSMRWTQTNGWADVRPFHRRCSAYYVGSVNELCILRCYTAATWQIACFTKLRVLSSYDKLLSVD